METWLANTGTPAARLSSAGRARQCLAIAGGLSLALAAVFVNIARLREVRIDLAGLLGHLVVVRTELVRHRFYLLGLHIFLLVNPLLTSSASIPQRNQARPELAFIDSR